jgi:hypothetical protein
MAVAVGAGVDVEGTGVASDSMICATIVYISFTILFGVGVASGVPVQAVNRRTIKITDWDKERFIFSSVV